MRIVTAILIILFWMAGHGPATAADRIGVVLMHGKTGTSKPKSPLGKLSVILNKAGILTSAPDMPWSRSRFLDKDYDGTMDEIDRAVEGLKKRGATKIVVGGHSMGANAALGYGARREGLAGVMMLAPGHTPSEGRFQNAVGHDYKRAKKMVEAGKGATVAKFSDTNQAKKSKVPVRADVYLSWYDMAGPATMPGNAKALKPGTALLWAVGRKDRIWAAGEAFVYSHAPKNPKSRYLEVRGGHKATPTIAAKEITAWLKSL